MHETGLEIGAEPAQRPRLRRARKICTMGACAIVASLLLRFVLRDRIFPFNLNFYIPPLVSGMLGIVCATLAHLPARHRIGLSVALLIVWIPNFLIDQPRFFAKLATSDGGGDFNVMSYNVKSYSFGANKVIPFIVETNPDILCLVEGTFRGRAPDNVKKAVGAEYHWAVGNTLSIASRYPIIESKQVVEVRDIKVIRAVLETPRGQIAVYDVDVRTPPFRSDRKAFDELYSAIANEELPAIIAGDFNTPRGSYHINRAMEGWTDSFVESSTDGYLATWRHRPFPLWQIDHQFHNAALRATSADIGTSTASDHFPLMVSYRQID